MQRQLAEVGERLDQQGRGSSNAAESPVENRASRELPARLAERISKLKEFLSAHPEMAEPEMRLLEDDDWIDPVRRTRLDTEADTRKALAWVRIHAQSRLGGIVAAAVRDYLDANNGQAPTSAAQLAPYLADPANTDLLQGLEKAGPSAPQGFIFQKASSADDWYGSTCYIGDDRFYANETGPGMAVEFAITAFQRATGNPPADASQLVPYLHESVSPSTLSAIFAGFRPSQDSPPVLPLGGGTFSTSGSGTPP